MLENLSWRSPKPASATSAGRRATFALRGIDGKTYSLADVRGRTGTLVVFICNHCPYVRAVIGRLVEEAKALDAIGIGTIAIMPNDARRLSRGTRSTT